MPAPASCAGLDSGRTRAHHGVGMTGDLPPAEVLEAFGLAGGEVRGLGEGACWAVSAEVPVVVKRLRFPSPDEGVRWEVELRAAAREAGWPVATPVLTRDGRASVSVGGETWTCEGWLGGVRREPGSAAGWRIHGRLLARLHRDLAQADPGLQRPGMGKVWELDVLTQAAGAGAFNGLVAAFALEHGELAAAIRRERYRNLRELSRLGYPELPEQPIHGDFSPRNLLWREGLLGGVVDWEFARRDAAICDLAPLLVPFEPLDGRWARALFEGYASVRPLTNQEFALLPALVRAALLWWVAVQLIRWRRTGGGVPQIARTMTVRFPAFERFALELGALRLNAMGPG